MKFIWILLLILMPSVGFAQIWSPGGYEAGIFIIVSDGAETPCTVDFEDFIAFARAFRSVAGDPNFNIRADTNLDGHIGFVDFVAFAGSFGQTVYGDVCRRLRRSSVSISGQVMQSGRPVENVWVDAMLAGNEKIEQSVKTDALGHFDHVALERGEYAFVAKRFGYAFEPDTVRVTVEDSSVIVPTIQTEMTFGVVDVKVLRDGLPVSDVNVSLLQAVAGRKANGPWSGTTDPSGATVVRIPVLEGESNISGIYIAKVTNIDTGEVLDSWMSVPIQAENKSRLVLDIGNEANYISAREYFYYDRHQGWVKFDASTERLKMWFYEGVDDNSKITLLDQLGLKDKGNHVFELMHQKGHFAVRETIHHLRHSGLVRSVTPELDMGYGRVHQSDHLIINFKDDVSEDDMAIFLEEIHASVVDPSPGIHKVVFLNFLSYDVFEICEMYRTHPLITSIRPDIAIRPILWYRD